VKDRDMRHSTSPQSIFPDRRRVSTVPAETLVKYKGRKEIRKERTEV
jgi:hypothetical protein